MKAGFDLVQFRPSLELKETLLHEMIHAWMFLQKIRDQGDHGPRFQERMNLINKATFADHQRPPQGYNITVYHSMHAEVDLYRTHHWQCPKCGNVVKRAMNRPPQEADCRGRQGKGPDCKDTKCAFHMHQRFCGGDYVKIAEPEGFKKKGSTRQPKRAFADGTALPVKRPRTSNTADPDAARSNKRSPAITDFFNSTAPQATNSGKRRASDTPGPQALVGAQDKRQDEHFQQNKVESGFVGSVHSSADNPAVLANAASPVDQSSVVQSHQRDKFSQPVKDADLSAERRRQLMADAATRRLLSQQHETASTDAQHGASGHSSRGSKPTVLPAHTGNLVPTGKGTSQPALHAEAPSGLDPKPGGGVAHVSAVIDLVDDDEDELQQAAQPKSNSYPSVCGSQQSSCPICGQMWGKTMSNVDISKHLDQCLCLQLL
ncbi:hypothetical protein ABBQ38_000596 [Trebouxia sp. C0009 RCD-2024]